MKNYLYQCFVIVFLLVLPIHVIHAAGWEEISDGVYKNDDENAYALVNNNTTIITFNTVIFTMGLE